MILESLCLERIGKYLDFSVGVDNNWLRIVYIGLRF